jgi:hypothetical protein
MKPLRHVHKPKQKTASAVGELLAALGIDPLGIFDISPEIR